MAYETKYNLHADKSYCFKFQEADLNGDGSIDKEEFINVFDTLFGLQGKVNAAEDLATI